MDTDTTIRMMWSVVFGFMTSAVMYFEPIHHLFIAVAITHIVDFGLGLFVGLAVQSESISKDKAFKSFKEILIVLGIICFAYYIGNTMKGDIFVHNIITWVVCAAIYFYSANIAKNLHRWCPNVRFFKFLWFVLNVEFLKRNTYLKAFSEKEKKEKEENIKKSLEELSPEDRDKLKNEFGCK